MFFFFQIERDRDRVYRFILIRILFNYHRPRAYTVFKYTLHTVDTKLKGTRGRKAVER